MDSTQEGIGFVSYHRIGFTRLSFAYRFPDAKTSPFSPTSSLNSKITKSMYAEKSAEQANLGV